MPQAKIGVIGGTGLYQIEGLTDIEEGNKMKNGELHSSRCLAVAIKRRRGGLHY